MWKMNANGSNDHHNMSTEQVSLSKLLPGNPKPKFACSNRSGRTTVLIPPCSTCSHSTTSNLLGLQHNLAKASDEQNMMELNEQAAAAALGSTSRWNPTPEQILTLEEMYRRGMRTPSADQIQLIAAQLRRFGKIEGKNVFYWFQNHKARERQRRRREVETRCRQRKHDHVESLDKKEAGLRTSYELEQTKKMMTTTPPPNRNKHPEGLVSLHKTAMPDNRTHGWSEYEERELQQQQRNCCLEKHSTWRITAINSSMNLQRQQQTDDEGNRHHDHDHGHQGVKTLKLFPIGNEDADCTSSSTSVSSGTMSCSSRKDTNNEVPITAIDTNFSPNQFFEFLPLKN